MTQEDSGEIQWTRRKASAKAFCYPRFFVFFFLERARKVNGEDHVAMQNACL